MREGTKEYVAEEQRGFSSGRGYVDKIFVLKQLVEKYRGNRREMRVYFAFGDLEKEYNKACREEMRRELHACRIDGHLIRSMSSLYDESGTSVLR